MDIKRLARRNLGRDDRLLGVIYILYEYCYAQHCNDFFITRISPSQLIFFTDAEHGIIMHVSGR